MLGEKAREPHTEASCRVTVVGEAAARADLGARDGVAEERRTAEDDREEGVLEVRAARTPSVGRLRHCANHLAALPGPAARPPGEREPRHEARLTLVAEGAQRPVEDLGAVDVAGREPRHQVVLKRRQRTLDHRCDEAFPAAEVVEDRGVRDAHVRSDLGEPHGVRSDVEETPLGGVEDRPPRLVRGAPPPPPCGRLPVPTLG